MNYINSNGSSIKIKKIEPDSGKVVSQLATTYAIKDISYFNEYLYYSYHDGLIEKTKLEDCIERLEYYLEHKREEMYQDEIAGFNDIIANLKSIEEK